MNQEFLTIKDIAELEQKSIKTIRRAIASNELFAEKVGGNFYSINREDYHKWKSESHKTIKIPDKIIKFNRNVVYQEPEFIDISEEMKIIDGWNNNYKNGFKFLDLFSGAGGLSCGMVMAGFTPVSSVEILQPAVDTYTKNFIKSGRFPNEKIETRDIRDNLIKKEVINICKKEKVDIIVGGFPCQGFSMAGNRVVTDPRNSLYLDMLEIVKEIKPKFVVMENVEGLRSMLNGKIEQMIVSDYQDAGYNISVHTLNAANYGVAQQRKRVIFIANNIGLINYNPKPILNETKYKTLGQELERFFDLDENKEINHIFTKHTVEMQKRLLDVPEGKSLYKNYSDAWKKSLWDKPSCTIKENHGGVNIHPKLPRVLTPRELAALQSFPDDFIFEGTKKWQLLQIGNAVPPIMAKAIGLAIYKTLKNK
ncbi:MAG: DNA (cytosine-5-)-methyltransferase [Spiroplasma phoeniceum]|nr:MAG: DNA (cytosine-5-)-methyltransferase [Spiroplasma phoeniceum]UZQ32964.1 MAG: DNA (cytosine-5-)-methyltransferase [Spiroplasma phoeniceum]